jgi:hypothetical protein
MGFKFLEDNTPEQPAYIAQEMFMDLINYTPQTPLSVDDRPAVFLQLNRNRNTIDDNEWNFMLEQQRRNLMEYLWEQGHIVHTIVSQDIDGFTLRTELLF